jgi:uncharacterized protein YggE
MSDRTIQVTASGRQTADPDEALVRVGVVASAADAVTARQQLAADVSRMRDALTEAGIGAEQRRTDDYTLYQESPHHEPHRAGASQADDELTYIAIQTFRITTTPPDVGDVIDTAVTNGATRVEDVQFRLSGETRDRLRMNALEDAMVDAREQTETIAASAGLSIEGIQTVRTGGDGDRFGHQRTYETAQSADATAIDAGSVTVVTHLTVIYDVTERGC